MSSITAYVTIPTCRDVQRQCCIVSNTAFRKRPPMCRKVGKCVQATTPNRRWLDFGTSSYDWLFSLFSTYCCYACSRLVYLRWFVVSVLEPTAPTVAHTAVRCGGRSDALSSVGRSEYHYFTRETGSIAHLHWRRQLWGTGARAPLPPWSLRVYTNLAIYVTYISSGQW